MKIIDSSGDEIQSPDLSLGHLEKEKVLIAHHDAVAAVEGKWHYETSANYPNGGRDVVRVIDVPGVAAQDAWDQYEDVLRYIPYTAEELAERDAARKPTADEQIAELREALDLLLSGVTK